MDGINFCGIAHFWLVLVLLTEGRCEETRKQKNLFAGQATFKTSRYDRQDSRWDGTDGSTMGRCFSWNILFPCEHWNTIDLLARQTSHDTNHEKESVSILSRVASFCNSVRNGWIWSRGSRLCIKDVLYYLGIISTFKTNCTGVPTPLGTITYPLPGHLWTWFSFFQGGMC